MNSATVLTLGEPWPADEFTIPPDGLSFGWHSGNFLLIGDPHREVDLQAYVSGPIHLGFAQHGPLTIMVINAAGLPASLDSARPYLESDPPPEIVIDPADHILWQLVLVQAGVVTNLRAFTTSPDATVFLRRAMSEQRAQGPLTYEEADRHIESWFAFAPSEAAVWASCAVTCQSGD